MNKWFEDWSITKTPDGLIIVSFPKSEAKVKTIAFAKGEVGSEQMLSNMEWLLSFLELAVIELNLGKPE